MKIGLALGGGGAKTLSFLPILELFERYKIDVYIMSGVSMGAVIGALYGLFKDVDLCTKKIWQSLEKKEVKDLRFLSSTPLKEKFQILEKSFDFVKRFYLWNIKLIKPSILDSKPFIKIFREIFNGLEFKDLKIPLKVICTDLNTGSPTIIDQGKLISALLATCSLPGVFPPYNNLVDGGIITTCPAEFIREECDFLIAFSCGINLQEEEFKDGVSVLFRADLIRQKIILENSLEKADFIFEPLVSNFSWLDFEKIEEIMKAGREEAEKKIERLIDAMNKKRKHSFLRRWINYGRKNKKSHF